MFYLSGICISLFLSVLLIGKKNKTGADKILVFWLLILCLHFTFYYISFSAIIENYPFLFGLHFPMPLLHGPFLYLYAGALTKNPVRNKQINFLHFIPVIFVYLAYVPFFQLPLEQKISIVNNGWTEFQLLNTVSIVSIIISGIIYVVLTSVRLQRHRRSILHQFSYIEKINLRWLQYLTYGIGLVWVFIIFSNDEIIFAAAVLFILFVGYFGIKQVGIFTQGPVFTGEVSEKVKAGTQENNTPSVTAGNVVETPGLQTLAPEKDERANPAVQNREEEDRNKKYLKSGLTGDLADELHQKLSEIMRTEKLFKENDLTLAQLAGRLHTHPNYLSQVINDRENKNFFDYINTLRTREFLTIVSNANNQKYTLLGLAYECGFNSKSSFNKYFKKITGKSPTEYLEALKAERHDG